MSICPNCNKNLPEEAAFCTGCGTKVTAAAPAPAPTTANTHTKLHCPNCKSHNISISTESSVNSAVSTQYGRHTSTRVSNTHRNFWFCADCGTKFRNIPNLEEEIHKNKSVPYVLWAISAIAFVVFIIELSSISGKALGFLLYPLIISTGAIAISFLIVGFVSKSKLKKNMAELEYLKKNCFN